MVLIQKGLDFVGSEAEPSNRSDRTSCMTPAHGGWWDTKNHGQMQEWLARRVLAVAYERGFTCDHIPKLSYLPMCKNEYKSLKSQMSWMVSPQPASSLARTAASNATSLTTACSRRYQFHVSSNQSNHANPILVVEGFVWTNVYQKNEPCQWLPVASKLFYICPAHAKSSNCSRNGNICKIELTQQRETNT